jgi:hypothetical protein
MKRLHFEIMINAPKEKVWHAMLDDQPYREWTSAFGEGGHYIGDWSKGSNMRFIGIDEKTGKEMGMASRIAENIPYQFISIEHVGFIKDGVEDTTSEEAKSWLPAFENYTLMEEDGATRVMIDMDSNDQYEEMFNELWPKALRLLKNIAER